MDATGSGGNISADLTVDIYLNSKDVEKAGPVIKKTGKEGRRFSMELLGIMFAGMALQKSMQGLLSGAAEATGIFQLLSTALTIFFLPIMLALLPLILWFVEQIINADDETKQFVGAVVVLLMVFGFLLFMVGQMGLGIQALSMVITQLAGLFAGTLTGGSLITYSLFLAIAKILIVFIIIIVALALAWKHNFANIRGWSDDLFKGLSLMLDGFVEIFGGLWDLLIGIVELDGDKMNAALTRIFDGSLDLVDGLSQSILAIAGFLFEALLNIQDWLMIAFAKTMLWLFDTALDAVKKILTAFGVFDLLGGEENAAFKTQRNVSRGMHHMIDNLEVGNLAKGLGFSGAGITETEVEEKVIINKIEPTIAINGPLTVDSDERMQEMARVLEPLIANMMADKQWSWG